MTKICRGAHLNIKPHYRVLTHISFLLSGSHLRMVCISHLTVREAMNMQSLGIEKLSLFVDLSLEMWLNLF